MGSKLRGIIYGCNQSVAAAAANKKKKKLPLDLSKTSLTLRQTQAQRDKQTRWAELDEPGSIGMDIYKEAAKTNKQ